MAGVVDGVNKPCALPWFNRRRADPGIMGAGPSCEVLTAACGVGIAGNDAVAESGRGRPSADRFGKGFGRPVIAAWLGMKSKRGESRGAIPYWMANSLPRSNGILMRDKAFSWLKVAIYRCANEPSALILPVTSLHNFVFSRQYLLLEDLRATSLVHSGDLEDLRSVHKRVCTASHHCDAAHHTFVHLNARIIMLNIVTRRASGRVQRSAHLDRRVNRIVYLYRRWLAGWAGCSLHRKQR